MANTVIQLKWSEVTSTPSTLNVAEPAYSNTSGKLFIGRTNGGPIAVGGSYYTALIDAATNANTASAIVKRDASGMFSATAVYASLYGNANTASVWQTARTIGVSGDANGTVSIDGSADANIPLTLGSTGVVAGTYGGATNVSSFTVDSKGRITSAANVPVSISSTLSFAGDTGSGSLALATDTLTVNGGAGIDTIGFDANNTLRIDVDNTVIRSTGNQTITGNVSIVGNLIVSGSSSQINVSSLNVTDPMIYLAGNNYTSDIVDIGFAGNYYDGATQRHAGWIRKYNTGNFYAFYNYTPEPDNNVIDINDASYLKANIVANFTGGNVSGLINAVTVSDGGTGAKTFTAGQILVGNGTSAFQSLANTGTAGTYANAAYVPVITTDAYGRVSGITNTAIAIAASQITSGTLPIARGGTNQTSFTTGQRVIFDGTSLVSLANTTTTVTGGLSAANTITSFTVNSYGDVTAYTGAAIAIDTSQITSGTLGVTRGGTGAATFTSNGMLYGNGTGALQVTAAAGTSDQTWSAQLLTVNGSGTPVWTTTLNGGTF
jgi:hypothetical protein